MQNFVDTFPLHGAMHLINVEKLHNDVLHVIYMLKPNTAESICLSGASTLA
jgi:hypothetical protein